MNCMRLFVLHTVLRIFVLAVSSLLDFVDANRSIEFFDMNFLTDKYSDDRLNRLFSKAQLGSFPFAYAKLRLVYVKKFGKTSFK